jgi:hypothetical protein
MVIIMEKVFYIMIMGINYMKENLKKMNLTDMVHIILKMEIFLLDYSKMVFLMEMVSYMIVWVIFFMKVELEKDNL